MWTNWNFYFILICELSYIAQVKSSNELNDESAILDVDVQRIKPRGWRPHQLRTDGGEKIEKTFKIEWTGNGDFVQHHSQELHSNLESELPPWEPQIQRVHTETDSIDIERSPPSTVLLPPFEFYSASINDFANEDTSVIASSTYDENNNILRNNSKIKTLRIYEITKSNSSLIWQRENDMTTERSFTISDPSIERNSVDSLRSVIRQNKNTLARLKSGKDDGRANGPNDRLPGINVIRDNPVKVNAPRGNRKYQTRVDDSDETTVRRNSWRTDQRYDWRRRRPINRAANHLRFFADSMRVTRVPEWTTVGRDTNNNIHTTLGRFPCPTNPVKHFYLADRASHCQIFYVCYGSETGVPMVCPNGTLFNQEIQVCDWWFNVAC